MQATANAPTVNRMHAWIEAHAAESAWLFENCDRNDFAGSLAGSLEKWGSLTDGQVAAIRRNLVPKAEAVAISVAEIEARFEVARGNQVKRPVMRLDTFKFKAVVGGANNGGIYVTDLVSTDDEGKATYLGKVLGGKFMASRACTDDQKSRIVAAASNPDEAAKAYGQRTGECCICGRELTAAESIERFIGPICAGKFGL